MAVITNSPPDPGGRFLAAYVDLPFLKKLFQSAPDSLLSPADEKWPEVWQNVYQFLQRSARIVIDAKEEEVLSEKLLSDYLLASGQYKHVDFKPNLKETLADSELYVNDPFSVFLLENKKLDLDKLRSRTGLLFLRHEDLREDWTRLFSDHVLDVNDSSPPFRWTNLCPHATPLNSIIVADRYAYTQFHDGPRSESFEQNLGALMDALLPAGPLDDYLHLTLVTNLKPLLNKHNVQPSDVAGHLRSFLESRRPQLDILLTVLGYREGGHKDRFIFTNYGLLTSNDSFSFFSNESLTKETLVHHFPNSGERSQIVRRRLHRMLELQKGRMSQGEWCYGDFRNRLLENVDPDSALSCS